MSNLDPQFTQTIRIAAVQAAPVFLDKRRTIEKVCKLIDEASHEGANIIGFPEGFIPSHPAWVEILPVMGETALGLYHRLFHNAVVIEDDLGEIQNICRDRNVYAVIGINERLKNTTGTLYNTQLIIGRDGEILNKHQKYVPTVGERLVHAPGNTGYKVSARTDIGGISGLICGENSNPLAQYAAALDYPVVHIAAWPQHFSPGLRMQDAIDVTTPGLACTLKAFVANCVAVLDDEAIEAYGVDEESRAFLKTCQALGGTSIIGPRGQFIAGPLGPGEGILYADVSANDLLIPKHVQDYAGHYNRPDLFAPLFQK